MKTSKCHYYYEGEQRKILLGVFTRFCRFSKGALWRKYPISTGRNGQLKPGKLLKKFDVPGIKQDSFQRHYYDIQGGQFFKCRTFFSLIHPVAYSSWKPEFYDVIKAKNLCFSDITFSENEAIQSVILPLNHCSPLHRVVVKEWRRCLA